MIGILGYGAVGKATHTFFLKNEDIIIHDITLKTDINSLLDCKVVFVCLPTNNLKDINNIKKSINFFIDRNMEIIVRSTVTPNFFNEFNQKSNITYFPEFFREKYVEEDYLNTNTFFYSSNLDKSYLETIEFINQRLKKIQFSELEVLKMMKNNYNAMKIVFANNYYDLCSKYDIDYSEVLKSFLELNNEKSYLEVNENLRSFGGKCLPKDLDFMIKEFGKNVKLFKSIKIDNNMWD
jgi:UDP-glucose 6-dehydrogenase